MIRWSDDKKFVIITVDAPNGLTCEIRYTPEEIIDEMIERENAKAVDSNG